MKFVTYDTPIEDVVAGFAEHGLALDALHLRGKLFVVRLGHQGAMNNSNPKYTGEGASVADAANAAFRAYSEARFALNFFWFNARSASLTQIPSADREERLSTELDLALDVLERVLHYVDTTLSDEQVRVVRETLKTLR
jgi:hypothetical protein